MIQQVHITHTALRVNSYTTGSPLCLVWHLFIMGKPLPIDYDRVYNDVLPILEKGFIKLNDALLQVNAGIKRDSFFRYITPLQKTTIKDIIHKNKNDHHRTGETYLGKMCRYGHEFGNSGKGLRYVSNSLCVICHRNKEAYGIVPDYRETVENILICYPLISDAHYLGRICVNNHKYNGHNYSVRYKSNKGCIFCHRDNMHLEVPMKRINMSFSGQIAKSLKNGKEGKSWRVMVDYSLHDLQSHLASKFDLFMAWDNYGSYWHVDHIIPKSYFEYSTYTDEAFKQCWSLDNLQPL